MIAVSDGKILMSDEMMAPDRDLNTSHIFRNRIVEKSASTARVIRQDRDFSRGHTFLDRPIRRALKDFSLETKVGHRSSNVLKLCPRRPKILDRIVPKAAAVVNLRSSTSLSLSSDLSANTG